MGYLIISLGAGGSLCSPDHSKHSVAVMIGFDLLEY